MIRISLLAITLFFAFHSCSNPTEPEPKDIIRFPATGDYEGDYWPTADWRSCEPEQVQMNSVKLMAAYEFATNPDLFTEAIVIIKNGYIVGEAYFNGSDETTTFASYSIAKSFFSALIGIALDKGLIDSVESKVYPYFSTWNQSYTPEIKKRVSIEHLLTMTSGIEWNQIYESYDLNAMVASEDYIHYVLSKSVSNEPGSYWQYTNGAPMLLSGIIEQLSEQRAFFYAYDHLFAPIGANSIKWMMGPGGHTIASWGIFATLHDYARFGYLFLKQGLWNQQQVISSDWVTKSTSKVLPDVDFYSYLWWLLPAFSNFASYEIPEHTYIAVGANGQYLYVVPEKELVIIRLGYDDETSLENWNTMKFLSLVLAAVDSNATSVP